MKVIKEICSFDELWEQSWSGAKDTLKTIMDNNKEDELMIYLEEIFVEQDPIPGETDLNDHLWFDRDDIFITLGIGEKE